MEDEVLIRLHLAEELRDAGYTAIEAASGDEAVTLLSSLSDIGLVLTDIRMPGIVDGLALAQWTRAKFPAIKIVVVSTEIKPGSQPVFDASLSKPVRFADLMSTVRQLLPRTELGSSSGR